MNPKGSSFVILTPTTRRKGASVLLCGPNSRTFDVTASDRTSLIAEITSIARREFGSNCFAYVHSANPENEPLRLYVEVDQAPPSGLEGK